MSEIEIHEYLPEDLVMEILMRADMNSVIKFRCVSKTWNSLITSDDFSRKHLRYSKSQLKQSTRLMVQNPYNGYADPPIPVSCGVKSKQGIHREYKYFYGYYAQDFKHYSVAALDDEPVSVDIDTKDLVKVNPLYLYSFVGSCDGLICLAMGYKTPSRARLRSKNSLILWNPSIRQIKNLPKFSKEPGFCKHTRVYGFGTTSDHDYKVVAFYECRLVKIYSLKTDQTKTIKNDKGGGWREHVFANGKLHWFVTTGVHRPETCDVMTSSSIPKRFDEKPCRGIAYLDLETEEFGQLYQKPESLYFGTVPEMSQGLQGELYVLNNPRDSAYEPVDVWRIDNSWDRKKRNMD